MKKLTLLFVLFSCTLPAFAQSLSIGVMGGLSSIQSPDSYTGEKYSRGDYGFEPSLLYGVKAKLGLPVLPIILTGQLAYTRFSNDDDERDIKRSLLICGAGIEWDIIAVPGPVNPYVALDLFYAHFGEVDYISDIGFLHYYLFPSRRGFSRTGLGLGAGVEFTLLPAIDLDAGVKYNFNNLVGKEEREESINTLNVSVSVLFNLN